MSNKRSVFLPSVVCTIVAMAARADDAVSPTPEKCELREVASLPLSIGESKTSMPTVPVTVGNSPASFIVGLSQPTTAITKEFADTNRIETQTLLSQRKFPFIVYVQRSVNATGIIPSLTIGRITIQNIQAFVLGQSWDVDGVIGLDLLSHMDVELNLKSDKVNLFSQDHCIGQTVYWGRPIVTLPFAFDEQGAPVFQMQLDGKMVTAKLDITKDEATMGRDRAEALFSVTSQTPGLKPRSDVEVVTVTRGRAAASVPGDALKNYDYVFKDLSVSGIEIHNLSVLLGAQPFPETCQGSSRAHILALNADQCNSGVDLVLGRNELRNMRLFFAFKEKTLYITGADPDPQSSAQVH